MKISVLSIVVATIAMFTGTTSAFSVSSSFNSLSGREARPMASESVLTRNMDTHYIIIPEGMPMGGAPTGGPMGAPMGMPMGPQMGTEVGKLPSLPVQQY